VGRQWVKGDSALVLQLRRAEGNPTMVEERPVYGCVGADRPEAQPFIEEVDGILLYVCPKCREEFAKINATLSRH